MQKAYDKAWLDAIMYDMYKSGLQNSLWQVVRNLNQNLTAQLQTKYGLTRDIRIKDSIRQGGVLSVIQYALLIDEINKEITIKTRTRGPREGNSRNNSLLPPMDG